MSSQSQSHTFSTSFSQEEWKDALGPYVEEVEEFSIVAKLSAGGVVVRTLRAPKSERPLFGVIAHKVQIAELRYTHNLTPYQPIMTMQYEAVQNGGKVHIQLAPHPEMMDLGILYNIAGIVLLASTIPMMSIKPQLSVISAIFGVLLLVYPALRARISFDEACLSALFALSQLPLGWADDQGTVQAPAQ